MRAYSWFQSSGTGWFFGIRSISFPGVAEAFKQAGRVLVAGVSKPNDMKPDVYDIQGDESWIKINYAFA